MTFYELKERIRGELLKDPYDGKEPYDNLANIIKLINDWLEKENKTISILTKIINKPR
jgi:hypothetical protein